jgi:putative PIN family toxin of toxin-antitoxin system
VRIVLDTNVLVSALKTHAGNCATILDLVLEGDLALCVNQRILDEYERVCGETRLQFDPEVVGTVLDFLRARAERVVPHPAAVDLPDPDDRPFLEVAECADAVLVSGNKKHFPARACRDVRVLSPAEFIEELRRRPLA